MNAVMKKEKLLYCIKLNLFLFYLLLEFIYHLSLKFFFITM